MLYWNNKGKYQKELDKLTDLNRNSSGSLDYLDLIEHLDRFNHDLYTNGLCNIDIYIDNYWALINGLKFNKLSTEARKFCSNLEELLKEYENAEDLEEEQCEEVRCGECAGFGKAEEESCFECEGSGYITEEILSEQDEHMNEVVEPLINKCSGYKSGSDELMDYLIETLIKDPKVKALCL